MRIHDFKINQREWLRVSDLENMFNIYLDKRGNYIYNLNNSVYFSLGESKTLKEYTVTIDSYWPLISYKLYGTTRFAWLLMKLNKVDAAHVFDKLHTGDVIRYVDNRYLEHIIDLLTDDTK